MLYSIEKINEKDLMDDVQTKYIEPNAFDLGNNLYLLIDTHNFNFEIIKKIEKGLYESLTVESINVLHNTFSFINDDLPK